MLTVHYSHRSHILHFLTLHFRGISVVLLLDYYWGCTSELRYKLYLHNYEDYVIDLKHKLQTVHKDDQEDLIKKKIVMGKRDA